MNAEIKKAWVADLRAHPEVQGFRRLVGKRPDGKLYWCVYGRLCELAVQVKVIERLEDRVGIRFLGEINANNLLPKAVIEWSGHNDFTESIGLAILNDNNASFQELADRIEEKL